MQYSAQKQAWYRAELPSVSLIDSGIDADL